MTRLLPLADPVPNDNDVVAGWIGASVFVLLILAVVFLSFSLVKQLRKAQASADAGVYGEEDKADPTPRPDTDPESAHGSAEES